ncbi:MAG: hypothetical protein AAB373_06570 [Patescibacteria group bacterium]
MEQGSRLSDAQVLSNQIRANELRVRSDDARRDICKYPAPDGIEFAESLDGKTLKRLAVEFMENFNLTGVGEDQFAICERLGDRLYARALFLFFGHRKLDFLAYVNGRYGQNIPFSTTPSLTTRVMAAISERGKETLRDELELGERLQNVHTRAMAMAGIKN